MNRYQANIASDREAEVEYLDADFHVVKPGGFVRCAVTGKPIALDELKYWSVSLQEAFASPDAALKRYQEKVLKAAKR